MHSRESIAHTATIDAQLDIQADCAWLVPHDTIERNLIETEMRRNRAIVAAMDQQYRMLQEWITRDDQENMRHERINATARERARQLSGLRVRQ